MLLQRESGGEPKSYDRPESDRLPTQEQAALTLAKEYRRRRMDALRKRRRKRLIGLTASAAALCLLVAGGVILLITRTGGPPKEPEIPDWIDQQLLDMDGHSRTGEPLKKVRDLAIHYVGNPDTAAINHRNYFNRPDVNVSSHFIVGLEGEIIQCLPLGEISAATNQRNSDTISIEVCHPDESGRFSEVTYRSLIKLCAWLCKEYRLDETNLIRHYDVTGKLCPLYYVQNPEAWDQLKTDVGEALAELKKPK